MSTRTQKATTHPQTDEHLAVCVQCIMAHDAALPHGKSINAKRYTKATTKRIHSVTIRRMVDESPDTSWLGEYANKSTSAYSIDRAHSMDCTINRPKADAITLLINVYTHLANQYNPICGTDSPDVEDLGEAMEIIEEKIQELEKCGFVGVRAEAEIGLQNAWNPNSSTMQRITSGGLWGIESDSDFAEIEQEQLSEL